MLRTIAALVMTATALTTSAQLATPPSLPGGEIARVEISLGGRFESLTELRVVSTDEAAIEGLAAVLRSAEPTGDHRCSNTGEIQIRMRSGAIVKLGTLVGHEEGYHQVRVYSGDSYSIFRVDRGRLAKALDGFGLAESALTGMMPLR